MSKSSISPTLTERFSALLSVLDDNPEEAAQKYIFLHDALTEFFTHRGSSMPTEMADETMERVASLISSGRKVYSFQFFYGVARLILKEHARKRYNFEKGRSRMPVEDERYPDPEQILLREESDEESKERLQLLKVCLNRMPSRDRKLIVLYYQGDRQTRISNRKQLAEKYHLTPAVLRVKVGRLRDKLEKEMRRSARDS